MIRREVAQTENTDRQQLAQRDEISLGKIIFISILAGLGIAIGFYVVNEVTRKRT